MDPRRRLQVLNQSNPSLRASVAPTPQLKVGVAGPQNLRVGNSIVAPTPGSTVQSSPTPRGNFGDLAAGVSLQGLGGLTRDFAKAPTLLHFLKPIVPKRFDPLLDKVNQPVTNWVDENLSNKQLAKSLHKTDPGLTQQGQRGQKVGGIVKGVIDVAGVVKGGVEAANKAPSVFRSIKNIFTGSKDIAKAVKSGSIEDIAKVISKEKSAKRISKGLGVDEAFGKYLAAEKNPDTIRAVLENTSDQSPLGVFDAMNPDPRSLPEGYHSRGTQPAVSDEAFNKQAEEAVHAAQAPKEHRTPTAFDEHTRVPRSKATAIPDKVSESKISDLITRAEKTPRPHGTYRVFQAVEDGANTDYVFDNVDSLDAFMSGKTNAGTRFKFHDVEPGQLTPDKAPGVFKLTGDTPIGETDKLITAKATGSVSGDGFTMSDKSDPRLAKVSGQLQGINKKLDAFAQGKSKLTAQEALDLARERDSIMLKAETARSGVSEAAPTAKPATGQTVEAVNKSIDADLAAGQLKFTPLKEDPKWPGSFTPAKLTEVINDDKLFEKYPSLKEVTVKYHRPGEQPPGLTGFYDPKTKTISLPSDSNDAAKTSSLIHEIQHAIQDSENRLAQTRTGGWHEYADHPLEVEARMKSDSLKGNYDSPAATDAKVAFPDADPDTQKAIQEVMDQLEVAKKANSDIKPVRAKERAQRIKRANAAYEAAGGGPAGMRAKKAELSGKLSAADRITVQVGDASKKTIYDDIENSAGPLDYEKLNIQTAFESMFGDTDKPLTDGKIKKIQDYFNSKEGGLGDVVAEKLQEAVKSGDDINTVEQLAGAPRTLMTVGDASAPRQLAVAFARHPIVTTKAYLKSFSHMFSGEKFKASVERLETLTDEGGHNYSEFMDSVMGMHLPNIAEKAAEESMSSAPLLSKIPFVGKVVEGSNRGMSSAVASTRFNLAKKFIDDSGGIENVTKLFPENELRDLGEVFSTITGRGGKKGGFTERHASILSKTLFSGKLWASRFNMLNPYWYYRLSGPARKEAIQSAASFAATAGVVLALIDKMPGVEVGHDMTSADWAKIKVGNTRFDILGGFQQNLRVAGQIYAGHRTSSTTGETKDVTASSVLGGLVEGKANPLISTAYRLLNTLDDKDSSNPFMRKDEWGESTNALTEVGKLGIPLPAAGVKENIDDTGSSLKGAAMSLPGFFGAGVQTYGTTKTKDKGKAPSTIPGRIKADTEAITKNVDDFKKSLNSDDQALLGTNAKELSTLLKDGAIDQEHYNRIQAYQDVLTVIKGGKYPIDVARQKVAEKAAKAIVQAQKKKTTGAGGSSKTKTNRTYLSQLVPKASTGSISAIPQFSSKPRSKAFSSGVKFPSKSSKKVSIKL